ncbi:MAG TPA: (Fe-S)-binding protein [Anaerolineae bacterium]|nr:(Fe-S)-binding protein [Anaerolineae bacterium]
MFIAKDYDLDLEAPGCAPGAEHWNATARFAEDMTEVFPYLNGQWKGVIYNVPAQQITWRQEGRAVAVRAREISISNLPDRDTATIEMEKIVAEINRIWMDRENLTPVYTPRRRLVAMEIYQLLPQTNCRLCGEATCFAFAGKLTVGQAEIKSCTPLCEDGQYADKHQAMLAMLAESGLAGT